MDRNWSELLSELRITQTGAQLLVGFLLTVPFQQRFTTLDGFAQTVYLVLVGLAVLATLLLMSPVVVHRVLFRRGRKAQLVRLGDRFARAGLAVLALVLAGVPLLLVDVVVSRPAGLLAGAAGLVLVLAVWVGVPTWAACSTAPDADDRTR